MSSALPDGVPPETIAAADGAASPDRLEEGRRLLAEQRAALLARDFDQLPDIHARLQAWITACHADAGHFEPQRLQALRAELDQNALFARQSSLQMTRALDALLPDAAGQPALYSARGLTDQTARPRSIRSSA